MSIENLLREKQREYQRAFEEHKDVVRSLQQRALEEIVPDIREQLKLGESDVMWASEYVKDTGESGSHHQVCSLLMHHLGAVFRLMKVVCSQLLRSICSWIQFLNFRDTNSSLHLPTKH